VTATTVDGVTGKITGFTVSSDFESIYFKRNALSHTESDKRNLDEGSTYVEGTVTASFKRRNAENRELLISAGDGQRDLCCVYKDGNGLWWYVPTMQLATKEGTTGVVKADGSKYDVTFVGEYEEDAREVEASAIADLFD
jgi:hypothetical protein